MNTHQVTPSQIQRTAEIIVDFIESSAAPEDMVMKSIMTSYDVRRVVKRTYDLIHNKNVPKFRRKIKEYLDKRLLPALTSAIRSEFTKSEISKAGTPTARAAKKTSVVIRTAKLRLIEEEGIAIVKPGYVEAMESGGDAARRIAGVNIRFDVLSPDALKYAQQNAAALITEITESARKTIQNIIAQGIEAGASNAQIAKTLQGSIGLHDQWALAASRYRTAQMDYAAAGKISLLRAKKRARRYAEKLYRKRLMMIARTETAIAQAQGSLISYKGIGVDRVRFYAAHGACATCSSMDGGIYRIEQAFGVIPVHPNGRCDWLSLPPKKGFKYPSQRAPSVFNLEEQAIAEILARFARSGKEHGALFDADGKILKYYDGGKNSINFTAADIQMIRKYGNRFIHNHPGGATFSQEDLLFSIANKLNELQAISSRDKFVFKLLEKGKFTDSQLRTFGNMAERQHKKNLFEARRRSNRQVTDWARDQFEKGFGVTDVQAAEKGRIIYIEESHKAMEKTSAYLNSMGLKNSYKRTTG